MSASIYIISIPLGLITVASFVARQQDHSFQTSERIAGIQTVSRGAPIAGIGPVDQQLPATHRLNHERYGLNEAAGGGALLGRDNPHRPVGERSASAPDWLSVQQANPPRKPPLPDISGFAEPAIPYDPLAEPIASESGYQITSDEVSRLDMATGRVVFSKSVRLASPQFHLACDQLVVHLGKNTNAMQLMEAHGSVNILLTGVPPEKAYRGQSGDAVFDPKKNQILLTGWPKVKGASQEQVAADSTTRMTLFTKTGRLLTEGRAQTRVTKSFMDESTLPSKK